MKEATGELNMTVITIVAIAAVAAFFYIFVWPKIQISIARNNCESECGTRGYNESDLITDKKLNPDFVCTCGSTVTY